MSSLDIHGLIAFADPLLCEVYEELFTDSRIRVTVAQRGDAAIQTLDNLARFRQPLDFVLTELALPGQGGIALIKRIRTANPEEAVAGGFRLRHLPIIACTSASLDISRREIDSIDRNIPLLVLPIDWKEVIRQVSTSLRDYRHSILKDFQRSGRALFWKDGRFQVGRTLRPRAPEGEYWTGLMTVETLPRYAKLVMMCEGWLFAESGVSGLEELLNSKRTTEADLHAFFNLHPEFLDQNYDSYWSEPFLKSVSGPIVRPDFVFQRRGQRELPWTWKIVDLKRPTGRLISNKRFHPTLSSEVFHLKRQLEDYGRFFEDPRNAELLRQKFGGVVPRPQLAGLIGRIPSGDFEQFTELRKDLAGVLITTYDEVLEARREYVSWMKNLFAS